MEKVFINKKFTQRKTLRTLQIDVFEILDNENIRKLFSKNGLLFLDQVNSNLDLSQMLTPQFLTPRASLPPSLSLSYFILANWNPSSIHSTTRYHNYWINQTIYQAKPIKPFIKLYTDHNILWVKHATHQKAESLLDASLSKLDNTVNNNSISNTKYAEFSIK